MADWYVVPDDQDLDMVFPLVRDRSRVIHWSEIDTVRRSAQARIHTAPESVEQPKTMRALVLKMRGGVVAEGVQYANGRLSIMGLQGEHFVYADLHRVTAVPPFKGAEVVIVPLPASVVDADHDERLRFMILQEVAKELVMPFTELQRRLDGALIREMVDEEDTRPEVRI